MENVWTCFWCKSENNPADVARSVAANVCDQCHKSRFLLLGIGCSLVMFLLAAGAGVLFMMTLPKREYTALYRQFYSPDHHLDPSEIEKLDRLARRYRISPETRDAWDTEARGQQSEPTPTPLAAINTTQPSPAPAPVATDPVQVDKHLKQGMIKASQEEYELAASEFEQVVRLDQKHCAGWTNLGVAYQQLHNYPKALDAYNQALSIQPNYWQAQYNLGTLHIKLNHKDQAFDWLTKALASITNEPSLSREAILHKIRTDRELDPIRTEPRFKMLLKSTQSQLSYPFVTGKP